MTNALTVVVLSFVGYRIFGGARLLARPDVRAHVLDIVRGLRWRHFLLALPVLTIVIVLASIFVQVPGLSWGWWSALGGQGNPVFGRTDATAHTPLEWLIPAVFAVLLIPALPLFAESEERMFRQGAERLSVGRRARRAVEFGLVHALIGIPIGVALALSTGGVYFTWTYLRAYQEGDDLLVNPDDDNRRRQMHGVMASTRAHLAYNATIVGVVAIALVAELAS